MKHRIRTEYIQEYIDKNNMTKTSFCKECGLSLSLKDKIMGGSLNFRLNSLRKAANFIGKEIYEMFESTRR